MDSTFTGETMVDLTVNNIDDPCGFRGWTIGDLVAELRGHAKDCQAQLNILPFRCYPSVKYALVMEQSGQARKGHVRLMSRWLAQNEAAFKQHVEDGVIIPA